MCLGTYVAFRRQSRSHACVVRQGQPHDVEAAVGGPPACCAVAPTAVSGIFPEIRLSGTAYRKPVPPAVLHRYSVTAFRSLVPPHVPSASGTRRLVLFRRRYSCLSSSRIVPVHSSPVHSSGPPLLRLRSSPAAAIFLQSLTIPCPPATQGRIASALPLSMSSTKVFHRGVPAAAPRSCLLSCRPPTHCTADGTATRYGTLGHRSVVTVWSKLARSSPRVIAFPCLLFFVGGLHFPCFYARPFTLC